MMKKPLKESCFTLNVKKPSSMEGFLFTGDNKSRKVVARLQR